MAFVTLFVSIIINLLLRVRVVPRKAGPLLDLRYFKEPSYILFCIGFFLIYWAVYFAFYYVRASISSNLVVYRLTLRWQDRPLWLHLCILHLAGLH
jgi:hypothetical protein